MKKIKKKAARGPVSKLRANVRVHIDSELFKLLPKILKAQGEAIKEDILNGLRSGKYRV